MKKLLNVLLAGFLFFFFFYSMTHRPDEEDFNRWLSNKYQITCGTVSCAKQNNETGEMESLIETGARTKEGYLVFNTVARIYEGKEGRQTTIKAIGFLGHYYPIVEEFE